MTEEDIVQTRKEFLGLGLSVAGLAWSARIEGGTSVLGAPSREVYFAERFFQSFPPHLERGFLLFCEKIPSPAPAIAVCGREGQLVYEVKFRLPGAAGASLGDMAIDKEGTVVVCGAAGNEDGTIARYLALLDPAGNVTRVIRTNAFQASKVCFAADDTVWTMGRNIMVADGEPREWPEDHEVFRHYSRDGRLLGKAEVFSSTLIHGRNTFVSGGHRLRASDDRVGAWMDGGVFRSDMNEWIELDMQGQVVGRYTVHVPWEAKHPLEHRRMLIGMALTSANELYASFQTQDPAWRGLARFDRSTSSWEPVPGYVRSQDESDRLQLLGADGDELVFRLSNGNLAWYPAPGT